MLEIFLVISTVAILIMSGGVVFHSAVQLKHDRRNISLWMFAVSGAFFVALYTLVLISKLIGQEIVFIPVSFLIRPLHALTLAAILIHLIRHGGYYDF